MELTYFSVCKRDGGLIVIIYVEWECDRADEFGEEIAEPDCFLGCVGESDVLSFCG